MDPAEVEFLAEKEMVNIVPNFALDQLYMIGGDLEPFTPGLPTEVPLWMAISLKQRQKCRIVCPEWMDVETLTEKKQEETESKFFTAMPSKHYLEVSQLLLQYATDDIPHADQVKTLIKDIWDMRTAKLRSSIDVFVKSEATHAKACVLESLQRHKFHSPLGLKEANLNHLTLMEINSVRTFLTSSLDHMHLLRTNLTASGFASQD